MDLPADSDGMALACRHCGFRPDLDLTQGVVAAHFETEHNTTKIHLDLIVVCPRDDTSMVFERRVGNRDVFGCPTCYRTRRIIRTERS